MKFLLLVLFLSVAHAQTFTPTSSLPPNPGTLQNKGELLGHNGTLDALFSPCLDGQIIEWDSAAALGFKCVAKPVASIDTNAGTICTTGQLLNGDGTCEAIPVDTNAATLCTAGQYLDGDGTCQVAGGGSGANTTLSNLTFPTAINQELRPATTESTQLGTASLRWGTMYGAGLDVSGSASIGSALGIKDGASEVMRMQALSGIGVEGKTYHGYIRGAVNGKHIGMYTTSNPSPGDLQFIAGDGTSGGGADVYLKSGDGPVGAQGGNITLDAGGSGSAGQEGSVVLDAVADKVVLTAQPTGGTALAVATTDYVDTAVAGVGGGGVSSDLSDLTSPTAINQTLLPNVTETRDLGSSSLRFNFAYANTLDLSGGANVGGSVGVKDGATEVMRMQALSGLGVEGKTYHGFIRSTVNGKNIGMYTTPNTNPGDLFFIGGDGTSGAGADIYLKSGDAVAGTTSGNITLDVGTPTTPGNDGVITLDSAADKAVLTAQPTGSNPLAIATTDYVDNAAGGGGGLSITCQTKFLQSTLFTASGDVTDLKFTGLTVGKVYKLTGTFVLGDGTGSGGGSQVIIYNNTTASGFQPINTGAQMVLPSVIESVYFASEPFTATSGTMLTTFAYAGLTLNGAPSNTRNNTHLTVCEYDGATATVGTAW